MKQWFLKTFRKKDVVKIRVYYQDKRARTYFVIPKGDNVSISGLSFIINKDYMTLEGGFPTFIFNSHNTEPINPLDFKGTALHTPETFDVALNAKIMREFMNASGAGMNLPTILSIMSLIGIVFIGLLLYTQIGDLNEQITNLTDQFNQLIGGGN